MGKSIQCSGGSFTGWVRCKKGASEYYTHFGNRAGSGGVSTTWCDIDGTPSSWGYVES